LQIIYEDYHLLAVNKPAPLLTQAPPGIPSLEHLVKEYIREKYAKPGGVYLGVPHRLDRPVSGVMVFARNTKAARRLADQFHQRQVEKTYWAIVAGQVEPSEGIWENWLRKRPEQARTEVVSAETPGARLAVLFYRVIGRGSANTFLEIRPHTGRSHQIRVQAAARGHSILGDVIYGSSVLFGPPADLLREQVIALHARSLAIVHPTRHERLLLTADPPVYWPTSPTF